MRCAPARRAGGFGVTLLDGVTGSGKTEVYFEAVAAALDTGKQVLILLPEIALTQAFLERFQDRFGAKPAEWHSDLPPRMRERVWRQVAEGRVRVVAGARSALFLPFKRTRPDRRRRGARPRLQAGGSRLLQRPRHGGGARPHRRLSGGAGLGDAVDRKPRQRRAGPLRARRAAGALCRRGACPTSSAIDMRRAPPARGGFLSPVLLRQMQRERWQRGEQSLLFLNRRGYAPLTLCRVCGHRFQCPDCSSWLVEHRFRGQLVCHHCGHHENAPGSLPGMRHARPSRRLRPRRRAHRRGGGRAFPGRAHHRAVVRHAGRRAGGCGSSSRRSPRARPTSSSARSSSPRATISRT